MLLNCYNHMIKLHGLGVATYVQAKKVLEIRGFLVEML